MTMRGILEFVENIDEDSQFLAEIEKIVDDSSVQNIASELVSLGSRNGFEFSEYEALQMRDMLRGTVDGDELTDEQLEMVAGGAWPQMLVNQDTRT